MNTQTCEQTSAVSVKNHAHYLATITNKAGDIGAATVAILLTALELATPNLTAQQRADLINQPEEN